MNIKIIYHGSLKRFNSNQSEKIVDVGEGATVGDLILKSGVPKNQVAFPALNGSRINDNQVLKNGDDVKLFQMVGGG